MRMLVIGPTGSGKSYWVYTQIFLKYPGRAIYIDPKPSRYIHAEHPRQLVLQPTLKGDFEAEANETLNKLIAYKIKDPKTPVLVVIDEAHRFGNKFTTARVVEKIVCEGRAANISTVIITQHATQTANIIILNCEYVALFGQQPIIRKYLEDRLATEIPADVWQHLAGKYYGAVYDWNSWRLITP